MTRLLPLLLLLCLCACRWPGVDQHERPYKPAAVPTTETAPMPPMVPPATNRIVKRSLAPFILPAPKPRVLAFRLTTPAGTPRVVHFDTASQAFVSNVPAILVASSISGPWSHYTNVPSWVNSGPAATNWFYITNPVGAAFFRPTWEFL
jgi:hypothetical protein